MIGTTPGSGISPGLAVLDFFVVFLGSALVGTLFGAGTALVFKHARSILHKHRQLEVVILIIASLVPFSLAETIDLSGIVTVLFVGMVTKQYTMSNVSDAGATLAAFIFPCISYLMEAFVFLNIGLAVFSLPKSEHWSVALIWWTLVGVLIGRALHVYPLAFLLNLRRGAESKISRNMQHMIWFAGLRGAIALAFSANLAITPEPLKVP